MSHYREKALLVKNELLSCRARNLIFILEIDILQKNTKLQFEGYSQGKSTLKLNSRAYEKYEYEHLGRWYIKLTLFKRF